MNTINNRKIEINNNKHSLRMMISFFFKFKHIVVLMVYLLYISNSGDLSVI